MGLDQHAHLRNQKIDWEDYYMNDNSKDQKVFVWRKHARLQQFMSKKWEEQNPAIGIDGHLSHLGFNADQEAPCYMTKEVVQELAEQIQKGFADSCSRRWFFWGNKYKRILSSSTKNKTLNF